MIINELSAKHVFRITLDESTLNVHTHFEVVSFTPMATSTMPMGWEDPETGEETAPPQVPCFITHGSLGRTRLLDEVFQVRLHLTRWTPEGPLSHTFSWEIEEHDLDMPIIVTLTREVYPEPE